MARLAAAYSCRIFMFILCLHGFFLGAPCFSLNPKTCILGIKADSGLYDTAQEQIHLNVISTIHEIKAVTVSDFHWNIIVVKNIRDENITAVSVEKLLKTNLLLK